MSGVSTTVWFDEGDLPTGYVNPGGDMGPFPVIRLLGPQVPATLQGYTGGDFAPYLRELSAVASRLADQLDAAKAMAAMAAEAPVCAHCALPAGHIGDHAPVREQVES